MDTDIAKEEGKGGNPGYSKHTQFLQQVKFSPLLTGEKSSNYLQLQYTEDDIKESVDDP